MNKVVVMNGYNFNYGLLLANMVKNLRLTAPLLRQGGKDNCFDEFRKRLFVQDHQIADSQNQLPNMAIPSALRLSARPTYIET